MADRIYKGPGIYGASAVTTIPEQPGTGTAYRDTTLTDAQIEAGLKKYDSLAASEVENEYLFRLSTLVDLIEKTGVLGWNAETVYIAGSVVVADDKKIYQAVQGSVGVNPTTDPGTNWVDYITANSASVSDASESVKGIIEIATNAEASAGNDDTKAITPAKLAAVISSEVVNASKTDRGIIQLATNAEAVAAVDDTKAITPAMLQAYVDANSLAPDASETVKGVAKLATNIRDASETNTIVTPEKLCNELFDKTQVTLGKDAGGNSSSGTFCVAIGLNAGNESQGVNTVAIGNSAGKENQGNYAVAVGANAGRGNQGSNAVSIGLNAGKDNQGSNAVAIGSSAANNNQPEKSIALGYISSPSSESEVYIGEAGASVFIGDGSVQAVSDLRDKENVADSNLGLNFIMQLQPKSWTANTRDHLEPNNDSKRIKGSRPHYGFIAQDVKQAMDNLGTDFAGYCELVHAATPAHKDRVKDRLTLRYQEFIGPMVKAMQEQQAMIDELKKEIDTLKGGKDV